MTYLLVLVNLIQVILLIHICKGIMQVCKNQMTQLKSQAYWMDEILERSKGNKYE